MEIANVHRLRLYRHKAATPFEFIDGCDIVLPQSGHSYFQLQGGHYADFSKNTSTMQTPSSLLAKYLWRKLKNANMAVSALTASLERVNITSSCSGLDFGDVKSVTLYISISEGDSHYQAGDFNQAIISYTAAIRKILNNDGDHDTALLAHFRSLSQRSEAYIALSNFKQAHIDARNALDLYNNCGYYFSAGLHPGELAAAIDRKKRTMLSGIFHAVGNSTSAARHSSHKKKSFHRRCQWAFIY